MTYITCETCNASYNKNNEFVHFLSNTHLKHLNQYYCQQCKEKMSLSEREIHLNSDSHKSNKQTYWCEDCNLEMALSTKSKHFKSERHKQNRLNQAPSNVIVHEEAINNFQKSGQYNNLLDKQFVIKLPDPIDVFDSPNNDNSNIISNMIDQILKEVEINFFNYKYDIQYFLQYHPSTRDYEKIPVWFSSRMYHRYELPNIDELKNLIEEYEGNGSGLICEGVHKIVVNVYKTNDIQASSYIPLPKKHMILSQL